MFFYPTLAVPESGSAFSTNLFYLRPIFEMFLNEIDCSLTFTPSLLSKQKIFDNLPTILFSGAGGIILPDLKYFSVNFSCRPRKSLNRLSTANSCLLNMGMFVLVMTRYATYELMPSPIFCGSVTVIIILFERSVAICN